MALGSTLLLQSHFWQGRTGPFWPIGSPKYPSIQASQRAPFRPSGHSVQTGLTMFPGTSRQAPPSGQGHFWQSLGVPNSAFPKYPLKEENRKQALMSFSAAQKFWYFYAKTCWVFFNLPGTWFTIMSVSVVLALALSGFDITGVGMTITFAGDTAIEWAIIILMVVTRYAILTELSLISFWTITPFNPLGLFTGITSDCWCKLDIVKEPNALWGVRAANLDSCDVGQYIHEIDGIHGRIPSEFWIFMESKLVLLHLKISIFSLKLVRTHYCILPP